MPRRRPAAEHLLALLVVLAAAVYATYALVRWDQYANGGFDLGIFDQIVWHYANLETPASSVKGLPSIFGDHVSPIFVLWAPLYWVWEDARMLLLAQAVLLAAAAVPIFLVCAERVGRRPGLALAAAYLAFWGVHAALAFDVHEVAFAPAIIAGILLAVQRRRWRWYAVLVVALLAVKEDQSILVAVLGLYVATTGERRIGALTTMAGIAWYLVATKVVIPANNPAGFTYWSYGTFGDSALPALGTVLTDPALVVRTLVENEVKRETLVLLFAPFLGLCLVSREAILLAPLVAERFLSDNANYWGTDAHYTLATAAVLVIGCAGGLGTLGRRVRAARRRVVVGVVAGAVLAMNVVIAASFPLGDMTSQAFYERAPVWADADRALAVIPENASIAAQDMLVPRLTQRETAGEISESTGQTDYVAAYVTAPLGTGQAINGGFGGLTRFVDSRLTTHAPVAYERGWLVLRRRALPPLPRPAALRPLDAAQAARLRGALGPWEMRYRERLAAATACAGGGAADVAADACARIGGDTEGRRLQQVLTELRPGLAAGCAELAVLAGFAVARLGADLDAVRAAGTTRPADPAALQRAAADAMRRIGDNALGYVARLRGLCLP